MLLSVLAAIAVLLSTAALGGCSGKGRLDGSDPVRINEIMSANSYFARLPDGSCYDWVEIYNTSEETVDLKGYKLSDNPNKPAKWRVPQTLTVEPHGYAVIYLSGLDKVDEYGNFHTNFKLSSRGETIVFSARSGALIQQLEIPVSSQRNISYGIDERDEDGGYVWMAEPTPSEPCRGSTSKNSGDLVYSGERVIINEYMTENTFVCYDRDGEYSDWVELYNPEDTDISLAGYALSDDGDEGSAKWFFPETAVIGAHGYLLVYCSGKATVSEDELHATFKLSGGDSSLMLYSASGLVMDKMVIYDLPENVSCGIDPSTGETRLFSFATPGGENAAYSYEPGENLLGEPTSAVIISELCSASSSRGSVSEDYIELYNRSDKEVSLEGCGLSDNDAQVKYTFPAVSVKPHEYLLVQCGGQPDGNAEELSVNFSLKSGGETVYLTDASGHLTDKLSGGRQTDGVSRGRLPTAMNKCFYFSRITPGAANPQDCAYPAYSKQPMFTVPGGIVSAGTAVRILAGADEDVRYTLDGSVPDKSSLKYDDSQGIVIDQTTILRAAAFSEGMLPSAVTTASYFVGTEHTLPIVSLVSDPDGLFSAANGIYSSSTQLTGNGQNFLADVERASNIEYFIDGKCAVSFGAGVRIFGTGSRFLEQKSFAVMLREIYGPTSVSFPFFGEGSQPSYGSFVLRQSGQEARTSKIHDELCSLIVRGRINCDYMDAVPVVLYVNGDYFGIYYIRDKLNEDYLIRKYGYTEGKIDIIKSQAQAISGTIDDYNELTAFVAQNDMKDSENYRRFCEWVDIDSLIDYWVCMTFFNNDDSSNIKCYRSQYDGGKWRWMMFDMDDAFFQYLMMNDSIYDMLLDPEGHGIVNELSNVIMRKMLTNEEFKQLFLSKYCYHLKTTFAPERTVPMLDELAGSLRDEIPRQHDRWGWPSVNLWERRIEETRIFLTERQGYIETFLKRNFKLSDEEFAAIYNAA